MVWWFGTAWEDKSLGLKRDEKKNNDLVLELEEDLSIPLEKNKGEYRFKIEKGRKIQ